MDQKDFNKEDFDGKSLINKAWKANTDEKEAFVQFYADRLGIYVIQMRNTILEAVNQLINALPHAVEEVENITEQAAELQAQLVSLEQKVQGVDEQTGHSIKSLQRIDKLKSKLENAASTLREDDMWAALTASLEEVLESGVPEYGERLTLLTHQVEAMGHSLKVFRRTTEENEDFDYISKRMHLESLYNKLEAAFSPPLIEALTQMDPDRTKAYVALFRVIGCMESVLCYWRRVTASRLADEWRALDVHTVSLLTHMLTAEADKQIDWLTNVLQSNTPFEGLVRLYTDLMWSLEPSMSKVILAKLGTDVVENLHFLTDLKLDIDEFVGTIKKIIDIPTKPIPEVVPLNVELAFGKAAYIPLRELLPTYTEIQTQLLIKIIQSVEFPLDDLLEYSKTITSIIEQCEYCIENAYSLSMKVAGEAAYPHYRQALENFIATLTNLIQAHATSIKHVFMTSVAAGTTTGVLSDTFAASMSLEATTLNLLNILVDRVELECDKPEAKYAHPLKDLAALLLDDEERERIVRLRTEPLPSFIHLQNTHGMLNAMSKTILKEPVDTHLEKLPTLSVWNNNNDALTAGLADYSMSPLECIAEVGQYLITLPQHLEMHTIPRNQFAWQYLSEVCAFACDVFTQRILSIPEMDEQGKKTCLYNIVYLSSMIGDLGIQCTPALQSLELSLRAPGCSTDAPSVSTTE